MSVPRFRIEDASSIKEYFDSNGYVILENGLDLRHLRSVADDISSVINSYLKKTGLGEVIGDAVFTSGIETLEAKDHEFVAAVYDTIYQTPSFMRLISTERIELVIRRLLQLSHASALYGFTNRCLIAPPEDERRTYGWHQEVFYTVPYGRYIQTWAPLVYDTNEQNGTIEILPGSHREGVPPQRWIDIPGRATQIVVEDSVTEKYQPLVVEMKLGELLLFSGKLVHRSGKNRSDKVRYSLVGMYHDVSHIPFLTPKVNLAYRGASPREFYRETFPGAAGLER